MGQVDIELRGETGGTMRRLATWIGRIPVWVWLLLAATQVLTLLTVPQRLDLIEHQLQKLPDAPDYAQLRTTYEEVRRDAELQLHAAMALAPLFIGMALWRWQRGGRAQQPGAEAIRRMPATGS
jgi:hypothetical protein